MNEDAQQIVNKLNASINYLRSIDKDQLNEKERSMLNLAEGLIEQSTWRFRDILAAQ